MWMKASEAEAGSSWQCQIRKRINNLSVLRRSALQMSFQSPCFRIYSHENFPPPWLLRPRRRHRLPGLMFSVSSTTMSDWKIVEKLPFAVLPSMSSSSSGEARALSPVISRQSRTRGCCCCYCAEARRIETRSWEPRNATVASALMRCERLCPISFLHILFAFFFFFFDLAGSTLYGRE